MTDISNVLNQIMHEENCSPIRAFFILSETGEQKHELHSLQSKPSEKTSRRLCDKSNI